MSCCRSHQVKHFSDSNCSSAQLRSVRGHLRRQMLSVRLVGSCNEMFNNVPDKIKPFGTLRDFGADHFGHYETSLYGHLLEPFGTLRDLFLRHYKTTWKIFL